MSEPRNPERVRLKFAKKQRLRRKYLREPQLQMEGQSEEVIKCLLDEIDRLKQAAPAKGVKLPGKLGDPTLQVKDDPRADHRMLAQMIPMGLGVDPAPPPVNMNSTNEELLAFCAGAEAGFSQLGPAFLANKIRDKKVEVVDEEKVSWLQVQ
jgi:hypothetical protein